MNLTLKDSIIARSRAISPWTGLYFLQSLLINLALGYPLSLLYSVAFTCILMLLWRSGRYRPATALVLEATADLQPDPTGEPGVIEVGGGISVIPK